jgi:hypothetical protein
VSPLAASALVTAAVVAIAVAVIRFGRHRATHPGEPWWRSAPLWLGASCVFALLGLFVAPKLLGFTFVFLPFLWIGGLGRREPRQPDSERTDHDA